MKKKKKTWAANELPVCMWLMFDVAISATVHLSFLPFFFNKMRVIFNITYCNMVKVKHKYFLKWMIDQLKKKALPIDKVYNEQQRGCLQLSSN